MCHLHLRFRVSGVSGDRFPVTVASISYCSSRSAGSPGSRRPAALRDILRHARDDDAGHKTFRVCDRNQANWEMEQASP